MGLGLSAAKKLIQKDHDNALTFLSSKTLADALPDRTKMISIPEQSTVGQALQILDGKGTPGVDGKPVLSAPVMSKKHGVDLGLFDVLDAVELLCKYSVFLRSGEYEQFVDAFFNGPVSSGIGLSTSDRVLPFGLSTTLLEVADSMLRVGTHRVVAVEDVTDNRSPIVAVLSQTQLLSFLATHVTAFETSKSLETQVGSTLLGSTSKKRSMQCVEQTQPLLYCFEKIHASGVSAVAVVDAEGRLINSVSASNIRWLRPDNAKDLLRPVGEWLKENNIKQSSSCHQTTTVGEAIKVIQQNHLHRLWVLDADNKPVSVITVGDLLRRFYDNAAKQIA